MWWSSWCPSRSSDIYVVSTLCKCLKAGEFYGCSLNWETGDQIPRLPHICRDSALPRPHQVTSLNICFPNHPMTTGALSLWAVRALQASLSLGGILDPPLLAFGTQRSYPNPNFTVDKIQIARPFFIALLREIKAIVSRVAKYLIWTSLSGIRARPWGWGEGNFSNSAFIVIYTAVMSVKVILSCHDFAAIILVYPLGHALLCWFANLMFSVGCDSSYILVCKAAGLYAVKQLGTLSRQVAIMK